MANSEESDEMQHTAVFHQGLHCLLRFKQPPVTELHHNLETSTCNPLKNKMGSSIPIVSICMGKSIGIQRVKDCYSVNNLHTIELKIPASIVDFTLSLICMS